MWTINHDCVVKVFLNDGCFLALMISVFSSDCYFWETPIVSHHSKNNKWNNWNHPEFMVQTYQKANVTDLQPDVVVSDSHLTRQQHSQISNILTQQPTPDQQKGFVNVHATHHWNLTVVADLFHIQHFEVYLHIKTMKYEYFHMKTTKSTTICQSHKE